MSWLAQTLRQYPEIAVFLSLGIGYWVGGKSYKGFSLGAVTACRWCWRSAQIWRRQVDGGVT